jgi:succinate dehydrogenase / fumarate reductase, flavoprotein subunit
MITTIQATMERDVGPLRSHDQLMRAQTTFARLADELGDRPPGDGRAFDLRRLEWFDLRNMLLVARTVTAAALARTESRGAHQREDFPDMDSGWDVNQVAALAGGHVALSRVAVDMREAAQ